MNLLIDVRDILPAISVPTLALHRTGDRACLVQEGRYVADRIPGAVFEELPGGVHVPWAGDQEQFFNTMKAFIDRTHARQDVDSEPDTALATVVCVLAQDLDKSVLAAHAELPALQFRGKIAADTDGIGLVVTFDGPARAVRFAGAVCRDDKSPNRGIRAGIHVGEVAAHGSRVMGKPVDVASELAWIARPGQILATSIVRDLATGSEIRFSGTADDQLNATSEGIAVFAVDQASVT